MVPVIYFVRHGETQLNVGKPRVRGWVDEDLDDHGWEQAAKAAKVLAKLVRPPYVIASDLSRTSDTAKVISKELGSTPVLEYGIRTWDMGALTYQLEEVVQPLINFYLANPEIKIPNGESFQDFESRLLGTIYKIIGMTALKGPLPIVAHHSCILTAEQHFTQKTGARTVTKGDPHPGGIMCLGRQEEKWAWTKIL